jgi:hypothetical protein
VLLLDDVPVYSRDKIPGKSRRDAGFYLLVAAEVTWREPPPRDADPRPVHQRTSPGAGRAPAAGAGDGQVEHSGLAAGIGTTEPLTNNPPAVDGRSARLLRWTTTVVRNTRAAMPGAA